MGGAAQKRGQTYPLAEPRPYSPPVETYEGFKIVAQSFKNNRSKWVSKARVEWMEDGRLQAKEYIGIVRKDSRSEADKTAIGFAKLCIKSDYPPTLED